MPGWGRPVFRRAVAAAEAAPRSRRAPGVDEKPPGLRLQAGPGAGARGEEAFSPLRSPSRSEPRRRRQLPGDPPRSTPRPAVRTPAAPCAPHPASPAGGRPRRGQPPAATHLARSGNHFSEGRIKEGLGGWVRGVAARGRGDVPAAGSLGSGRHAEVRLHLGKEAAAEPRDSASTSRGSLLTLHREEEAAEEEAAPGRPPPRARRPPSGRSRPRRTRLLRSAKPRSGRAALSTAAPPAPRSRLQQRRQQQAGGVQPGAGSGGHRFADSAEPKGAPASSGQGPRRHRVTRGTARAGRGGGGRSPVPVRRSLLLHTSTPPAPRWRRGCSRCLCHRCRCSARPPLPPWLGAVT